MASGVFIGPHSGVVMDPPAVVYTKVFHQDSEPDRYIKRKAEQVAFMARGLAPVQTGRLRASIKVEQGRGSGGRFSFGYNVSASAYHALYVHEGTDYHVYFANKKAMKFPGTKMYAGRIVFTDMVEHPGNAANPFLQKALLALEI